MPQIKNSPVQRKRVAIAAAQAAGVIGGGAFGACIQRHGWAEPMVKQMYRDLFHQMLIVIQVHCNNAANEWTDERVEVAVAAAEAASNLCAGACAGGVHKHGWTEAMIFLQSREFYETVHADLIANI